MNNRSSQIGSILSWVCLSASVFLPMTFWKIAFSSSLLPESRTAACKVLLCFVLAQIVAAARGVASFWCVKGRNELFTIIRSSIGIMAGMITAPIMAVIGIAESVGP
jgi:hypothetical protein